MRVGFAVVIIFICVISEKTYARGPSFGAGAGLQSCTQFARAYTADPKLFENFFYTWAQGYLTAWNIAAGSKVLQIDLTVWSDETQKGHLRAYCANNPEKQYVDAVLDLQRAMKYVDAKTSGDPRSKEE